MLCCEDIVLLPAVALKENVWEVLRRSQSIVCASCWFCQEPQKATCSWDRVNISSDNLLKPKVAKMQICVSAFPPLCCQMYPRYIWVWSLCPTSQNLADQTRKFTQERKLKAVINVSRAACASNDFPHSSEKHRCDGHLDGKCSYSIHAYT